MRPVLAAAATCLLASSAHAAETRVVVALDPADTTTGGALLTQAILQHLAAKPDVVALSTDRGGRDEARLNREREQAIGLLTSARDAFDSLELAAAARDYAKAVTKLGRVAELSRDIDPLLRGYAMLAASHLLLGQDKRAREHLEELLTLDPKYELDQAIYNPQMLAVVEAVRAEVTARPRRDLLVQSEPPGAIVVVDGRLAGVTPVTVPGLLPGDHYVFVNLPRHQSEGRSVAIGATAASLSVTLEPAKKPNDTDALISTVVQSAGSAVTTAVQKLAQVYRADEVILLSSESGVYSLARMTGGGVQQSVNTVAGSPSDLDGAIALAQELLGLVKKAEPVAAIAAPAPLAVVSGGMWSAHPQKNTALWGLYGGGAACGVVAATFGYLALRAEQRYGRIVRTSDGSLDQEQTHDQVESRAIEKSGKRNALIADLFAGLALAAAASGVALHFTWEPGGGSRGAPASSAGGAVQAHLSPLGLVVDF